MTSIYRTIRDFWRGYSIDDVAARHRADRILHRAAVEAGYADLAGYIEKYG